MPGAPFPRAALAGASLASDRCAGLQPPGPMLPSGREGTCRGSPAARRARIPDTNQVDQSRERRGEIPGGGPDPQANPARPALEDGTSNPDRGHRNDTGNPDRDQYGCRSVLPVHVA